MQQNIEFERCIDFLVRMIDKYGAEVLRELEEEKQNKEEKEAAVSFSLNSGGWKTTSICRQGLSCL